MKRLFKISGGICFITVGSMLMLAGKGPLESWQQTIGIIALIAVMLCNYAEGMLEAYK